MLCLHRRQLHISGDPSIIYDGQCRSSRALFDHIILPWREKGNRLWAQSSFNMNWQASSTLTIRWNWEEQSAGTVIFFIWPSDFLIIDIVNLNSPIVNTLLACDDFPCFLTSIFLTLVITSSTQPDFVGFPLSICVFQPYNLFGMKKPSKLQTPIFGKIRSSENCYIKIWINILRNHC